MKSLTAAIMVLVTVLAIVISVAMYNKAQEAKRQASIADRNAAAAVDTIRRYQTDSSNAINLMAFQDSVNTDSLIKLGGALGQALEREKQTARTLTQTRFEFTEYRALVEAGQEVSDEGDRSAAFNVDGPPIEGTIGIVAPADTAQPMVMNANLSVTPFNITYVIGCDEQQSAFVNLESPDWISMTMQQGTVDPNMCHPYQPVGLGSFKITTGGLAVGGAVGTAIGILLSAIVSK